MSIASTAQARPPSPTTKACVAAAEEGQRARTGGKLRDARRAFIECASASCPNPLRSDCAKWLEEVDEGTPTLVCGARDADGRDLEATVQIDGEAAPDCARGSSIVVDPGPHVVRFDRPDGSHVEEHIVAHAGERQRLVIGRFGDAGPRVDVPSSRVAVEPVPAPKRRPSLPTASWVLGGVGVVGLGSFATFGLVGRAEREDALRTCAPACTDDDVAGVRTAYVVADVSLVVSVVALGAAAIVALLRDDQRLARTIWK